MISIAQLIRYRFALLAISVICIYGGIFVYVLHVSRVQGVDTREFLTATGDSGGYVSLAETMLSSHRFALEPTDPPEVFRTPGYPAFLASLMFLFGSLVSVGIVQMFIVATSAVSIASLGERFFSRGVGFFAALAYVFEPTALSSTFVVLSDTLFVSLFLATTWFVVEQEPKTGRVFTGGLILGLAALVRPLGLFLAPLFLIWLLMTMRGAPRRTLFLGIVFAIGLSLAVVPWMSRNEYVGQHFSLSSISTYNPLFYNVVGFEATRTGKPDAVVRSEIITELGAQYGRELDTFQYADKAREVIRTHLLAHPFAYGFYHLEKTLPFFFASGFDGALALLRLSPPAPQEDINISALLLVGDFTKAFQAMWSSPAG